MKFTFQRIRNRNLYLATVELCRESSPLAGISFVDNTAATEKNADLDDERSEPESVQASILGMQKTIRCLSAERLRSETIYIEHALGSPFDYSADAFEVAAGMALWRLLKLQAPEPKIVLHDGHWILDIWMRPQTR